MSQWWHQKFGITRGVRKVSRGSGGVAGVVGVTGAVGVAGEVVQAKHQLTLRINSCPTRPALVPS